jgi:hypothetical protein
MANQPPVNPNHNEMRDTLTVCGIDVASANRVIDTNGDGVDSLQSFAVLTGKDVETMIYNAGRRQVNQGGRHSGVAFESTQLVGVCSHSRAGGGEWVRR